LNSDRFAIRNVVTAIRNAFMRVDGRPVMMHCETERRASVRSRLEVAIRITTADVDAGEVQPHTGRGSAIDGVSHDISLGGLGFTHSSPLSARCAIVRFDIPGDEPVCLAVELVWSNRAADGSWISGSRILGLTDPYAG
jgi:hypothetical protein